MKRKRLALLLAVVLTVTSVDSTAMIASAADFTADPVVESEESEITEEEAEEPEVSEETPEAATEDVDIGFSDGDAEDAGEAVETDAPEIEENTDTDFSELTSGESGAETVSDGADRKSVVPDEVQEIGVDEIHTVNIENSNDCEWFSFTPTETGTYSFCSMDCDYNAGTKGFFFDSKDYTESLEYYGQWELYSDGGWGDFKLRRILEAGKTYYYCAKLYDQSATGSFNVKLIRNKTLQSIHAILKDGKIVAGIPEVLNADVQYIFTDGTMETTTIRTGIIESPGKEIDTSPTVISIKKEDDPTGYVYEFWESLPIGKYTVTFSLNGITSNELKFQAVDIEEALADTLHEGENPRTKTSNNEYTYYKFVPSVTGIYEFENYSWLNLYVKNEEGSLQIKRDNKLTAGTAYYIQLWGCVWNGVSSVEYCNLNIRHRLSVAEISFTPAKTVIYDSSALDYNGRRIWGNLAVTYDDGSSWNQEYIDCTNGSQDEHYNQIRTVIKKENGSVVENNNELEAGSYSVYLQYGYNNSAVISEPFTLIVKAFDINDCPLLTEGTSKVTAGTWYAFKPKTKGIYEIKNTVRYNSEWKYLNDEGELEQFSLDDRYEGAFFDAGRTYLVCFNKNGSSGETGIDCMITPVASPVKLTVTSRTPSEEVLTFVKGMDEVNITEIKAEVLFEDGKSSTVERYAKDRYGRYLNYELMKKDASGNYSKLEWSEVVATGDYVYRVWYGKDFNNAVYADDIPVKVITIGDTEKIDLDTGTQTIPNKNGSFILKFRPEKEGRYEISFNVPISDAKVFSAENESIVRTENKDYAVYMTLQKDIDYYIQIKAEKKYKDISMTTSLLTQIQSLKAKAYKTTYIAGVEEFDADTIETELTYSDGTTRKVRNQEEINGYYLQYWATKDDSKIYNGNNLTSGTWRVEPYLSASEETESAVAADIPAEGAEITAEKPELSDYPFVIEDVEETVSTAGRTIYAFRAEQDGTYVLESDKPSSDTVWFYRDGEDALEGTYERIGLRAGEICAVIVNRETEKPELKFKVTRLKGGSGTGGDPDAGEDPDTGETPITGKILALTLGMTSLVKIDSNDLMECIFTPEETGDYIIWSEYNKNTSLDPYVELYDLDNKMLIENDDADESLNFRLIYKLEKGKRYCYKVRMRSESASFYLKFNRFDMKEIQKIEAQAKEGYDAAEFSVLDEFSQYFDMKVTYTDGTVKILNWDSNRDSCENNISTEVLTDNKITDEELTYKVRFSAYNKWMGEDDYKEISESIIKCKGLSGLPQITLTTGSTQVLPGDSEDYRYERFIFHAPESGEYIVHIDGAAEGTATAEIYTDITSGINGSPILRTVTRNYEADGTYSFQLKKDEWYIVTANALPADGQQPAVSINKAKDIRSLELIKAPEQTTLFPNNENVVSLEGMEVKVTYTDGNEETVAYGQTDSDGRYLQHNGVNWINAEKCRVYVRLGRYQVSFDATAGSRDDVKELELNKETKLTAAKGEMITLKLNAAANDIYVFDTDGCYVKDVTEAENGKVIEDFGDQIELQKDTLYYVHVYANRENPVITVRQGTCVWKETSRKEATCTEDGVITETCNVHGEIRTAPIPALGHDTGDWQTTKNATCTADGEKAKICKRCKAKVETQVIPKLGHNLGNRQTVKAATCGASGESARICTRCKNKFEKQTINPTGKHKYGSWKTTKAATALATGSRERTCTVCKKKDRQTIAKLKATLTLSVAAKKTLPLKLKGSYKVNVQMTKGDSVVSWKSSNSRAVSVDKYGKVTAKQAGKTARITVKLRSGLSTWFNVSVQTKNVATTSLKLKNASTGKYMPGNVTLKRNQKLKVTPVIAPVTSNERVTYVTSNKSVVIVDSKGQITAKGKGTAYITAKSGKKSVRIKIVVK